MPLSSTPNRDYRLHPLFCVDMNANTCISLNSKQCTCMAFNLNASFELDVSSIRYLAFISKILALTSKAQSKWWRWCRRQITIQALDGLVFFSTCFIWLYIITTVGEYRPSLCVFIMQSPMRYSTTATNLPWVTLQYFSQFLNRNGQSNTGLIRHHNYQL